VGGDETANKWRRGVWASLGVTNHHRDEIIRASTILRRFSLPSIVLRVERNNSCCGLSIHFNIIKRRSTGSALTNTYVNGTMPFEVAEALGFLLHVEVVLRNECAR
jgi:hypothetical protein